MNAKYKQHNCATALLAGISLLTASCASRQQATVQDYLDPLTGQTITAVQPALIFTHQELQISAALRNYIYLGLVDINKGGTHSLYLWIGPFSTIDHRYQKPTITRFSLVLDGQAEDISAPLPPTNRVGLKTEPYKLPLTNTPSYYVPLSHQQLLRLAAAKQVSIRAHTSQDNKNYSVWSGNIRSLGEFVTALDLQPPNH